MATIMTVWGIGPKVQEILEQSGGSVSLIGGKFELSIPDDAQYRTERTPAQQGRWNTNKVYPQQIAHWWLLPNGAILSYLEYEWNGEKHPPMPCAYILESAEWRKQIKRLGFKSHKEVLGF